MQRLNLFQRILYNLFIRYVDKPHIPQPTNVRIVRDLQKGEGYNKIKAVTFMQGNDTSNEYYVFNDFGNNFNDYTAHQNSELAEKARKSRKSQV